MTHAEAVESREKVALVWAERRERLVAIRVHYDVLEERGCKLYLLNRIEEAA